MTERDEALYRVVNLIVQRHVYSLPVDVEGLCRLYGATLLSYSEAVGRSLLSRDDIAGMAGTGDGFTLDALDEWAIVYNDRVGRTRIRFTLAEELMHRLLLHSQDENFDLRAQSWTQETYALYEAEAKRAAGMLLVPPTVYYRCRRSGDLSRLARLCAVSEACVRRAAQDYDRNEDEIRAHFTHKHIACTLSDPAGKRGPRPVRAVGFLTGD